MGKTKEHPRYNVISLRVTDEELMLVKGLAEYRQEPLQNTVRHALNEWIDSILPKKEVAHE